MKVLQINTNRSRPAHDIAVATATELEAGIVIISEPNLAVLRDKKDWVTDDNIDTAIKSFDRKMLVRREGRGHGFSYIGFDDYTIYSCYSSPNGDLHDLNIMLEEIASLVRSNNEKAIIAGDFNAKSPQWGMAFSDRRGQIITEWIAANDYVVINQGDKPTFERENYAAILDLTIATSNISSHVVRWEVSEKESLSDHNFVVYEITEGPQTFDHRKISKGWNVNKLDRQKLKDALDHLACENSTVDGFSRTLKMVCEASMPIRRNVTKRKPAYWWNQEIAAIRQECVRTRRLYSRSIRKNQQQITQQLWDVYKQNKKILRDSIKSAKKACWISLLKTVEHDIFGNGYKIAMRRLKGLSPKPNLTMPATEEVVRHLFPVHERVVFDCCAGNRFENFTPEELSAAIRKLKDKKTPGPSNIPPEVVKEVASFKPTYVLSVYNDLAARACFPAEWKQAKLLLLKKGDKLMNDPGSYRPISLLDVEGKLYEHLILARLKDELQRTGGLSEKQFGFREGRQTTDAINEVIKIAREAAAFSAPHRRICVMVTLDVKNAFNSASWQLILAELRRRGIDNNLVCMIASYLSERYIILEAEGNIKKVSINSGVPQGSVLGPTLWNTLYDDLLEMEMPEGVTLIGFADDVAMVASAKTEELLMTIVNTALLRVVNWMEVKKLQLAPQKTEAVLLTTKRKLSPIIFNIQGIEVRPKDAVKYLGVWLDTKLVFSEHVKKVVEKAEKTVSALSVILPNIGGPKASKRKVLASVVHSQLLYAAPIWHNATHNMKIKQKLSSVQRKMSIRVCSAYRTISTEAVGIIAGIPPIELLAKERADTYSGIPRRVAKEDLLDAWQQNWNNASRGRWTYRLIPEIRRWLERPYGQVDYFLTQALSGHGCFREYLFDRKIIETNTCSYCDEVDNVEHTLFRCIRWHDARLTYQLETGNIFNVVNMMGSLVESKETWNHAYRTIRCIIEAKERESRE